MKFCLINNFYGHCQGGAERVVAAIAQGLTSLDYEVFIITLTRFNEKQYLTVDNGIKVYRLPSRNFYHPLLAGRKSITARLVWRIFDVFNFWQARAVKKILQLEKPDIVNTHNLYGLSYLLPLVIKKLNVKHLHTLHDIQLAYPSGTLAEDQERKEGLAVGLLRSIYELICRRLFGSPFAVISPSAWLMEFYAKRKFFLGSKKVILTNPLTINLDNIGNLKVPLSSPKNGETFKLLFVGQITFAKGVLFLIKSLAKVNKRIKYSLRIVGQGRELLAAKKLASSNSRISFWPQIESEKLAVFYSWADLTIIPSLICENSPNVLRESMFFGTPVLAADTGGIRELIKINKTGWLFEAGSESDLGRQLMRIYNLWRNNRKNYLQICQRCRVVSQEWLIGNYLKKFLRLSGANFTQRPDSIPKKFG